MNKKIFLFSANCKGKCPDYFELGRDNYNYFYRELKRLIEKNNFDFTTKDLCSKMPDVILLSGLNQSKINKAFWNQKSKYLLLQESPHVDSATVNTSRHESFRKIFTWNDELIDNEKYYKVNYAFDIPKKIRKKFEGKILCCTIAGNKTANHLDELYSKRVELIRWFEKYYPNEFDLYGVGWDEYNFGRSLFGRALNKIKFLKKIFAPRYISYKGKVVSKNETMQNYKFAICYENIKDQSGYITEKIFDCFFAGCVPIYWGAKNITEHIPKECFIDKRDFDTYEELYDHINNMDSNTYMDYLENIENFLNSSKADPFRAEVFAETIVNEIVKDLDTDAKSNS